MSEENDTSSATDQPVKDTGISPYYFVGEDYVLALNTKFSIAHCIIDEDQRGENWPVLW